jgi:hypothetical protein
MTNPGPAHSFNVSTDDEFPLWDWCRLRRKPRKVLLRVAPSVIGDGKMIGLEIEYDLAWRSARRPMLQHPPPLPDGQLDARPMLDGRDKDFSRLVEAVARVQQGIDTHAVPAPRFDLVEVAVVCVERVVGLLV